MTRNGKRLVERGVIGGRQPAYYVIDEKQREYISVEFKAIGGDPAILAFNEGSFTGYDDAADKINIKGNIFPREIESHPRSRMSVRAVLAHELAHRHHRFTPLRPGSWNDEFRTSYWAAKNIPNPSKRDRADLINDAMMRAHEERQNFRRLNAV